MRSHGKWFAGLMFGLLGGCFVSYGYNEFDGTGAGGTAVSASSGSSSNSSNSSGMGGQGTGGSCGGTIQLCGESIQNCNTSLCFNNSWAKRFGLGETVQGANDVALDAEGNIVIAGNYTDKGFKFGVDSQDPSVPTTVSSSTAGFLTRLNPSGTAEFAEPFLGQTIQDVAVDGKNDIIVAGNAGWTLMLKKVTAIPKPDGGANLSIATLLDTIGGMGIEISTNAITIDENNSIYVVGINNGVDGKVNCGAKMMLNLFKGMFVIKFDTNLACQWIQSYSAVDPQDHTPTAITAIDKGVSANGLWITGLFNGTLNAGDNVYTTDQSRDMFIIRLDPATGLISKSFVLGNSWIVDGGIGAPDAGMATIGELTPLAIDADDAGLVYLAGHVQGKTRFHPELFEEGQRGAFVATIDSGGSVKSTVLPCTADDITHGARATGITLVGDKVVVSGAFSGTMNLDAPNDHFVSSNFDGIATNSPFVAVLDATQLQLLTFDAYGGGGEPFATTGVHLAASADTAVLAGTWIKALDFSTDGGGQGKLPEFMPAGTPDIFVAKFVLPTP